MAEKRVCTECSEELVTYAWFHKQENVCDVCHFYHFKEPCNGCGTPLGGSIKDVAAWLWDGSIYCALCKKELVDALADSTARFKASSEQLRESVRNGTISIDEYRQALKDLKAKDGR